MPGSASPILSDTSRVIRAPERLTVMESAVRHGVRIEIPGKTSELYDPTPTYYMREPSDCLTSRRYLSVAFVGPAQSAKTFHLVELFAAYSILSDPMDTKIIEKDRQAARDFVRLKMDRLIHATPQLRDQLAGLQSDTLTDKLFRAGNQLLIGWPTENQLAGRPIGRMIWTDYDRAKQDIGGEGSGAAQAFQRVKTYGSRGMLVIESSPSKPVTDPQWEPPGGNRHVAPPTEGGVMSLYNQGDRRRLYGRCPECGDYMLPLDGPEGFDLSGKTPHLICTTNGCGIPAGGEMERKFKRSGLWVGDGQQIDHDAGTVIGDRIETDRASFWMGGAFAAFQTWKGLLSSYRKALEEYENTGDESTLKNCYNADFSSAYIPAHLRESSTPYSVFQARAEPAEDRYIVPAWCRLLLAAVDVQLNRFEVLVLGVGPQYETQIIARFPLAKSPARDDQPLQPAQYLEDWQVLVDRVVNATYRVEGTALEMRVFRTAVDLHGAPGVTTNALSWWRRLDQRRYSGPNNQPRVFLTEGLANARAKLVTLAYPDASAKKGRSATMGDVPVLQLSTNLLKDRVWADLNRDTPGPRYIHFPGWLDEKYYRELTAETRDAKGRWENPGKRRNETFDLLCMCKALWTQIGGEKINWDSPPAWALGAESNSETMDEATRRALQAKKRARKAKKRDDHFGGIDTSGWF